MSHFVFHPKSFIVKPHICPHIQLSAVCFQTKQFFFTVIAGFMGRKCMEHYQTQSHLSVTHFYYLSHSSPSLTWFYYLSHNSTICHIILLYVIWFCYLSNNSTICHTIIPSVTQFYHLSHNSTICHIILLYVTWFYFLSHNSNFSAF